MRPSLGCASSPHALPEIVEDLVGRVNANQSITRAGPLRQAIGVACELRNTEAPSNVGGNKHPEKHAGA